MWTAAGHTGRLGILFISPLGLLMYMHEAALTHSHTTRGVRVGLTLGWMDEVM